MFNSKLINHGRFITVALTFILAAGVMLAQMASARTDKTGAPAAAATAPLPGAAALQAVLPWVAVASTGAVDEADLDEFAFTNARVSFLGAVDPQDRIIVRYNVENPNRFEPVPGWTRLELTSAAPGGSQAQAALIRVDPCTGQETAICTATNPGSAAPVCRFCQFNPNQIDFAQSLYYVRLTLIADQQGPVAHTLRLLP